MIGATHRIFMHKGVERKKLSYVGVAQDSGAVYVGGDEQEQKCRGAKRKKLSCIGLRRGRIRARSTPIGPSKTIISKCTCFE